MLKSAAFFSIGWEVKWIQLIKEVVTFFTLLMCLIPRSDIGLPYISGKVRSLSHALYPYNIDKVS